MRRPLLCTLALTLALLGASVLTAQDGGKIPSGPKVKSLLKAPFDSYNLNGQAKGRYHCLVCEFGQRPSVLVFVREGEKGKDDAVDTLMLALDKLAAEYKEEGRDLKAGVVFLSPDAHSSATQPELKESKKLVEEAARFEDLTKRLAKRAEGLKHVVVSCFPDAGPKKYDLSPKAEVTAVVYDRLKVKGNFAYGPGQLRADDVETIVRAVREMMNPDEKAEDGKKG